jgi:predicted 2-oxoglutarate/Fe(II)-dependent dioxygenase YbiX
MVLSLSMCLLASASVQVPPAPRLHAATLEPAFSAAAFVSIPNFLHPSLVSGLIADVESLRMRLVPTEAAPAFGSVEWFSLMPTAPSASPYDDAVGVAARDRLLAFVEDMRGHVEARTGVALDAGCDLKYAYYPCGGRYQKHVDGGINAGSVAREWSFLLYLNEGWTPADGGHLRVFDHRGGDDGHYTDIAPAAGTLVVFKSDVVPHEVRPTTKRRLAIVGWLHRHVAEEEEAPDEAEQLSDLALAIREHYRTKGKSTKFR